MSRYRTLFAPAEPTPDSGDVTVTYLGVTSLLFSDGRTNLLIDGFFSRPSLPRTLFRKLRTDTAAVDTALNRLKLSRVDAIFAAHTHYDHAFDVGYVARRTGAHLYGSRSTRLAAGKGPLRASVFEPGMEEVRVGSFRVTVLRSAHAPIPFFVDDVGEEVSDTLVQPARVRAYKEGGSYDFVVRHGPHTVVVKPSAGNAGGALDTVRADVLLLGVAQTGSQSEAFRERYYARTVGRLRPGLVIPIHWDDFTRPLSDRLVAPPRFVDDLGVGMDFLVARARRDGVRLRLLQGYQRTVLFPKEPAPGHP